MKPHAELSIHPTPHPRAREESSHDDAFHGLCNAFISPRQRAHARVTRKSSRARPRVLRSENPLARLARKSNFYCSTAGAAAAAAAGEPRGLNIALLRRLRARDWFLSRAQQQQQRRWWSPCLPVNRNRRAFGGAMYSFLGERERGTLSFS